MRRTLFFGLLWLLAVPAFGQQRTPRFEDFPVNEVPYRGPHAVPKLQPGTAAWRFRTRIRKAAKLAPNFAGHYVLAGWGCGSSCIHYVIVDVKTGYVYFDNHIITSDGLNGIPDEAKPLDFRLNSRLLIFTGRIDEVKQGPGPHFFQLRHGRLVPVR